MRLNRSWVLFSVAMVLIVAAYGIWVIYRPTPAMQLTDPHLDTVPMNQQSPEYRDGTKCYDCRGDRMPTLAHLNPSYGHARLSVGL